MTWSPAQVFPPELLLNSSKSTLPSISLCYTKIKSFTIHRKGYLTSFFSKKLSLSIALLEPVPNIFKVVEKWTLTPKVSDFILLYDANPLIGHTVGYVGVVVHAIGHQLALRRQGEMLQKCPGSKHPLLQITVFPHFKREVLHGRSHPAVWGVSLINVDKQEVCHIRKFLNHPPENRQLAYKGGSSGRAEVDH